MAGNSNSGRRSQSDEEKRLKVIDKAWDVIDVFLHDEDISLKAKAEMAAKLVVKNMPTEIQGSLDVTMMPTVKVNGKELEADIG